MCSSLHHASVQSLCRWALRSKRSHFKWIISHHSHTPMNNNRLHSRIAEWNENWTISDIIFSWESCWANIWHRNGIKMRPGKMESGRDGKSAPKNKIVFFTEILNTQHHEDEILPVSLRNVLSTINWPFSMWILLLELGDLIFPHTEHWTKRITLSEPQKNLLL